VLYSLTLAVRAHPSVPRGTGKKGGQLTRTWEVVSVTRKWAPIPGYRGASPGEKLEAALDRMRDRPIPCPLCSTGVDPRQLEQHAGRCPARHLSLSPDAVAWMTWGEIRGMGICWGTLHAWLTSETVQVRRRRVGDSWHYSRVDVLRALERLVARRRRRRGRMARIVALARWRRS
jgi:hypothetical protein